MSMQWSGQPETSPAPADGGSLRAPEGQNGKRRVTGRRGGRDLLGQPVRAWRRQPLRVQLVAVVLALVALALAVTGVAAAVVLRDQLLGRVDTQLQNSLFGFVGPRAARLPQFGGAPGGPQVGTPFFVGIYDADGNLQDWRLGLPANKSQGAPRLPLLTMTEAQQRAGSAFTVAPDGPGSQWRVMVQPAANGAASVVVALSLEDVKSTVNKLVGIEVVVSILVLVLLAGVAYAVVRTSLRRLREVERTAGAIAAGDLSRRVPVDDERTEVGRLGAALNVMLSQIEAAFRDRTASEASARASEERMRRFVADASHELRTPLTSIRGFAELHRQGAVRDEAEVSRLLGRIEGEAQRMGLLVDDLLLLARLDQQRPLEHRPVDLLTLAADAVADAGAIAPHRPIRLLTSGLEDGPPPVVSGDEARLRQVVGNLVSNALRYTPPESPIAIRVAVEEEHAVLEVIDHGPGLAEDDARRIFERFYRADASRTRGGQATGGSGLGLSIVAALVAAHGGTVSVQTAPGAGATFRVRLPLQATAATEQEESAPARVTS
jgi:two-component system OmpR family sensor kinase